jgi:putative membrane protein
MNPLKTISTGMLLALVAVSTGIPAANADDKTAELPTFVQSSIESQEFVERAAAAGIADVELAKLALSKSAMEEVRHFAQVMLADHTAANKELRKLATAKGMKIPDEATLVERAKSYILEMSQGETFDEAYAKNQLKAHTEALNLYRRAANSDDVDVKNLADVLVPTLEHHFSMAETLVNVVARSAQDVPSSAGKR